MIPITVDITAGTIEDADAFGELVASVARQSGFNNVSTNIANSQDWTEHAVALNAMSNMNPDIFRTPVIVNTDQFTPPPPMDDDPEY